MHSNPNSTTYYVNLDTSYLWTSPFSPVPTGIFQRLNVINAKHFVSTVTTTFLELNKW